MNEMQEKIKDFETALKFLAKENNIKLLERVAEQFIISFTSGGQNLSSFVPFRTQLKEIFDEHSDVIYEFLKGNFKIEGHKTNNPQVFDRLQMLQKMCSLHLNDAERALALPNSLKFAYFSFANIHPYEVGMILMNNDSSKFSTSLDFNGALNLINQLLLNFDDKINRGANNFNIGLIEEYKKRSNKFMNSLEEVMKQGNGNIKISRELRDTD